MQHAIILHILKTKHTNLCLTPLYPQANTPCFHLHLQQKSLEKCFPSFLLLPRFLKATPVRLPSKLLSWNKFQQDRQWFSLNPKVNQPSGFIFIEKSATFNIVNHSHLAETFSSVSLVFFPSLTTPFISLLISSLLPIFGFLFPIIVTQTFDYFIPNIFTLVALTSNLPSIYLMTLNLYFHARSFPELHAHICNCLLNSFIFMSSKHLKPNMAKIEIICHTNTHFSCSLPHLSKWQLNSFSSIFFRQKLRNILDFLILYTSYIIPWAKPVSFLSKHIQN